MRKSGCVICYFAANRNSIRLATHFHTEHLLDREHYMDWLLTSLESTPQAKLPVWLLITQIYWKDILQFRKYGHRLSAALLNHLAEVRTLETFHLISTDTL